MTTVTLTGCRPEPLASYLKALGVLRLVATQADRAARGHWGPEGFVLDSSLPADDLCAYFLERYSPTPVVSPWNGGSGFGPKDNTDGIDAIAASTDARLQPYRTAINAVRSIGHMDGDSDKRSYLLRLRNELPDEALAWIDAATVLGDDAVRYPILLGTGGNDGRLDFSNNFMQRLVDALAIRPPKRGMADRPHAWLRNSLFENVEVPFLDAAIGQFDPGSAGGSNSSPQGKGKGLANPWDFVLMIEGAVVFAAAAVRRRGERAGSMSIPFAFSATAAGYGSAADESGRGEVWAPLWAEPSTLRSVTALFGEGRVSWKGSQARSGLDAVRSVATLQHDRRITAFTRFAIAERFGLSNVAVPVGRIISPTQVRAEVAVTATVDPWLGSVKVMRLIPTGVGSWLRMVERSMFDLAQASTTGEGELLLDVLVAVAELEHAIGRSGGLRGKVSPVRGLTATDWLGPLRPLLLRSVEARIAWSLASGRDPEHEPSSLRELLLPVDRRNRWRAPAPVEGFGIAPLSNVLAQAAARREWITGSTQTTEGATRRGCRIAFPRNGRIDASDAVAFATGEFDTERLERCLRAFLVLNFDRNVDGVDIRGLLAKPTPARDMPMSSAVAAVLAHAGSAAPAIPSPVGLTRQLLAGASAAVDALRRSVGMEGYTPEIAAGTAMSPWLAPTLLLNPWRSSLLGTWLDRCGYRPKQLDSHMNSAGQPSDEEPNPQSVPESAGA